MATHFKIGVLPNTSFWHCCKTIARDGIYRAATCCRSYSIRGHAGASPSSIFPRRLSESYQKRQAGREVMEHAKGQISKECVEALVLRARIDRMSRIVGRVAIAIFVVMLVASVASPFFKCIGCGHGQY